MYNRTSFHLPSSSSESTPFISKNVQSLFRKSKVYDKDAIQGNGMRAWYSDYTTIDWIHDHVKDRMRLAALYCQKGWRGRMYKYADACQAWIVLSLIGIFSGWTASFVDISTLWLYDLRQGYCISDIRYRKSVCNKEQWITWNSIFKENPWISSLIFISLGSLFAFISSFLVIYLSRDFPKLNQLFYQDKNVGKDEEEEDQGEEQDEEQETEKDTKQNKETVYHAAGSGLPQIKTILGGFVIRKCLGLQTFLVKTLSLIPAIASGLVIGQQGPLVHISCCIGNIVSRLFTKYNQNEGKRREILSASCAAGVSVAFGAPIGGVLFSLEEVSYYFPLKTMWRSFYCGLIAALTLTLTNPFGKGKMVKFKVDYSSEYQWDWLEGIPFCILGILGGIFGSLYIHLMKRFLNLQKSSRIDVGYYSLIWITLIAFLTNCLSMTNELLQKSNIDLITELLQDCVNDNPKSSLCDMNLKQSLFNLGWVWIVKVFGMMIVFGSIIPSGLFIPCITLGALLGRIMSSFMFYLQEMGHVSSHIRIQPIIYALVGAGGVVSGVTRMTVSLVIIMFELTGSLSFVVPLMMAIMLAKWVADSLEKDSIYDMMISQQGYPYLNHKRTLLIKNLTLVHVMDCEFQSFDFSKEYTFEQVYGILSRLNESIDKDIGFPILDGNLLVGFLGYTDLVHALECFKEQDVFWEFKTIVFDKIVGEQDLERSFDVSPFIDQSPIVISLNASMEMLLELFIRLGVKTVCVVDKGNYIGSVYKKRLLEALRCI